MNFAQEEKLVVFIISFFLVEREREKKVLLSSNLLANDTSTTYSVANVCVFPSLLMTLFSCNNRKLDFSRMYVVCVRDAIWCKAHSVVIAKKM